MTQSGAGPNRREKRRERVGKLIPAVLAAGSIVMTAQPSTRERQSQAQIDVIMNANGICHDKGQTHQDLSARKRSFVLTRKPTRQQIRVRGDFLNSSTTTQTDAYPYLFQELDVSFNPLECACPLWEFVGWAESLALFQEESLPCQRPKSLRKSRADGPEMICGPEVFAAQHVDQTTLSVGDPHRMCCVVSSYPKPDLWWEHDQQNITWGITQRHLSDSGRIEFCMEIPSIAIRDLGIYRCYAQLEDLVVSKEFHVRRAREPLVLSSPPNIIFYCQFSIGLFIFAFCCATCCILRRGRPSKTGPEKDNQCRTTVVHVLPPKEDSSNSTTPSYCSQEHYHVPVGCCLEDCQYVPYDEDCYAPEYPFIEERRYLQATAQFDDTAQRRISQWRHRIAAMPAPLAQFDKETNIMGIVHTAV
ncbi:hypothetical protein ANCCEY_10275 [Ancylostoma ceylanicum]|uniref:Ig-like domain-containing protein n=1 Tax=Ancylostoma ceylanicum TaxID=53326 RepID=A0A0D6LKW8_9BILA|nr:hypothetical protein ANCCEY_10275 [Ancylostoma ceylanicum]